MSASLRNNIEGLFVDGIDRHLRRANHAGNSPERSFCLRRHLADRMSAFGVKRT